MAETAPSDVLCFMDENRNANVAALAELFEKKKPSQELATLLATCKWGEQAFDLQTFYVGLRACCKVLFSPPNPHTYRDLKAYFDKFFTAPLRGRYIIVDFSKSDLWTICSHFFKDFLQTLKDLLGTKRCTVLNLSNMPNHAGLSSEMMENLFKELKEHFANEPIHCSQAACAFAEAKPSGRCPICNHLCASGMLVDGLLIENHKFTSLSRVLEHLPRSTTLTKIYARGNSSCKLTDREVRRISKRAPSLATILVDSTANLLPRVESYLDWNDIMVESVLVGEGAGGKVERARLSGSPVVIKYMQYEPRKEQEAIMLGKASHPNLIQFYGAALHDGFLYFVMADGGTSLKSMLKAKDNRIQSEASLLSLARQAACGLEYLHKIGITHRDLACRNYLVDVTSRNELNLRVADLGLARQHGYQNTPLTAGGSGYAPWPWQSAAPEILANEQSREREWNPATDVWAFGLSVWEMLTHGRDLFTDVKLLCQNGELQHAALKMKLFGNLRWLYEAFAADLIVQPLRFSKSEGILKLLNGCLQFDAPLRPRAREIRMALATLEESTNASPSALKITAGFFSPEQDEKIEEQLRDRGLKNFKRSPVAGDGNCGPSSIALLLGTKTAQQVRAEVSAWARASSSFVDMLEKEWKDPQLVVNAQRMGNDGAYVGEEFFIAASSALQRTIYIVTPKNIHDIPCKVPQGEPLFVAWNEVNHYDPLLQARQDKVKQKKDGPG